MRITVELDVYDIAHASAEHMAAFAQVAKSIADGRIKEENEMREQYASCLTGHEEKGIESEEKAIEPVNEGKSTETKKSAPKKASKKQGKPKIEEAEKPAEEHKDEPEPEEPAEEHKAAPVKSEPEEAGEPTKDSREEPEEPESKDPEEEPEEPAEKAITLEELQDLCKQRAKANKEIVPKLKELMIKFGIKKLHEIKKEDIPVFYKEVEALK
ncbi:hypothetical protein [Selenomonas bovis]|uniref:hypothetical protein n=1 Tax=Selenomonas bovis TaxID=416586 RepID=UPI00039BEE39|nr:hypothetical protein [Selenomonas bovis]